MTSGGSAFAQRRMGAPVRAGRQFWLLSAAAVLGTIAIVVPVRLATGRIAAQAPPATASGSSAHGLALLQRLPMQAQGEISTTIAAGASAFAARRTGSGYALTGGGVSATVGRRGVSFSANGGTLSLALAGVGRNRVDHRVGSAAPVARANRVSLHRPGALEWYAAGPLGIEQGFTVAGRPAGSHGPLTLSLRVGGSLRARRSGAGLVFETTSGTVVLRYGGLSAVDASGRALPASIALQGGRVLLRVGDRGARYPVRIDPFVEQHKIVPTDETGGASGFGGAAGPSEDGVALSSDGSTALIGGPDDGSAGSQIGAAWVFTRSGSTWSEQQKIVPTDEITGDTPVLFGGAVALSSDGSTALIGGNGDSDLNGAAWVYTRTGKTWSEQQKLTGAGDLGVLSNFGWSVALSPSGSTALIGGYNVDSAWIFTRSGHAWTQQQAITPADDSAPSQFGWSVALSGGGSTALIGAPGYNATGAVWVYTSSGGGFSEQQKIVPSAGTGFGGAVAVSSDGNTALIGTTNGNAAWVYTRASGSWSQQQKIVPTDEAGGASSFGNNVALSPDGNLALIGGLDDNSEAGAAWMYGRSGSTWSEQQKIVPSDESAGRASNFGTDVALSSDESTALIAGPSDNGGAGAVWAYLKSSSPPPPPPPGSKLSCTLKVGSDKVAVPKQHGRHPKPAGGTLTLKATCNAAANATLKGTVTEVIKPKHGKKKTKTVGLPTEHPTLTAGKSKSITVKVSAALVSALRKGAKDSVKFELSASDSKGTAKAGAEIAKLKS